MKSKEDHNREVNEIRKEIIKHKNSKSNKKIKFIHGSTNSTRMQKFKNYKLVDVGNLDEILEINKKKKYLITEPNVPMDRLVEKTLNYGLLPAVVMEFPGITVGGAIQGAALESSSFRYGQFNTSCLEYEIITGKGNILKTSKTKNSDLFYGTTGSYGTLGLLTSVKMKLVSSKKYVKLTYYPVSTTEEAIQIIKKKSKENVDYIDAIIFSKKKGTVIIGKRTNSANLPIQKFSGAFDQWFYKHAKRVTRKKKLHQEIVPIRDYLFRYDRGAYWMGDYFFKILKVPGWNNKFTRGIFNSALKTRRLYQELHATNYFQKFFIQDLYFPANKTKDYLDFIEENLKIYPIWLCPVKPTKKPEKLSPHYINTDLIINVGVWGWSKHYLKDYFKTNRDVEKFSKKINGRKMLYAQVYYPKKEFWQIYDKKWYEGLRKKYGASGVFPDVYEKTHVSEKYNIRMVRGILKIALAFLRLK